MWTYILNEGAVGERRQITEDSVSREQRMWEPHEAMNVEVGLQQKCELDGFVVKSREVVERNYVSFVVSYCSWYDQAKDMSAIRDGVAMNGFSATYMMIGDDLFSNERPSKKSVRNTEINRSHLLENTRSDIGIPKMSVKYLKKAKDKVVKSCWDMIGY